jgi:Ca2+-binding EF-hand superfamily protein
METKSKSKDETKSASPVKKIKLTQDEQLKEVEIKSIEKERLDRVFERLSLLQEEPSSDENSKQKIYRKQIESKANQKKMKISLNNNLNKSSTASLNQKPTKPFKEDDEKAQNEINLHEKTRKISVKAVRKILKKLCSEYPKDEMEMMVWEVDENLDGCVCEKEFEKMYKRCITDEREQQPKKLFYLVQFLMYDKDERNYITEEDTLEILYIRHGDKFNQAIDAIFEY